MARNPLSYGWPNQQAPCPSCGHCPTCGRSNGWWYNTSPWNTGSPVWPNTTTWAMNDGVVADNTNAISQADLDTKTECKC